MKTVVKLVVGLLVGIGLLIGGGVTLTQDEVTCGGSTMSAGDRCEESARGGHITTRDYEEQQSDNKTGGWIMIVIGSIVLVLFGLGLLGALTPDKERSRDPASV
ncbi:hypothetical protein ACFXNW_21820 [Nocardia sp. NPDC059180]|uniref:hypothetical protein n=1 Tax=Nocardia sp. NPDC059180 TaxID=3346761 RepID=UPI0036A3F2E5